MYRIGQPEIDAVAKIIKKGKLFRYAKDSECNRFETRWSKYLNVKHAHMTSSGTAALTAAMIGLNIGPGDEVIVPACTYMASAVAVLAVGAIPVIVDVDESATMDPAALDDAVGPQTKAVIPVHIFGLSCDMDPIMKIARKRKLLVIEDACQSVGGGYNGQKHGSIGHMGAFSFNYFKNISCGEGGAFVTNDVKAHGRAQCAVDCCRFYWNGSKGDVVNFTASGSRASEFEGAIMNAQLNRLNGMLAEMRRQKKRMLKETKDLVDLGLVPIHSHSPKEETAIATTWLMPNAESAIEFQKLAGGSILGKTGRHVYSNWDPVLQGRGGPHPALDPFKLPQNRKCRKNYSKDMCPKSLAILNRTVAVPNHPDNTAAAFGKIIKKVRDAAAQVLGQADQKPEKITITTKAAKASKKVTKKSAKKVARKTAAKPAVKVTKKTAKKTAGKTTGKSAKKSAKRTAKKSAK